LSENEKPAGEQKKREPVKPDKDSERNLREIKEKVKTLPKPDIVSEKILQAEREKKEKTKKNE